jgi:trimeric autotransporter adhesin
MKKSSTLNAVFLKKCALAFGFVLLMLTGGSFGSRNSASTTSHRLTATVSEGNEAENEEENDKYDGAAEAAAFEFEMTRNPATNSIPQMALMEAIEATEQNKSIAPVSQSSFALPTWTERGPFSDATGPSNGNTRANSAITAGRIRATWVDLADATNKTVWAGGVSGGLWKTTDITAALPVWVAVNDFLSNLAIVGICQDPTNNSIMYMCTGESFFNADAVRGAGVFKSTDGGANWTNLASTTAYTLCTKILCDAAGNVYLGTFGSGLLRSTNGGTSWTGINPTGGSGRTGDFDISSTGRFHLSVGLGNTSLGAYRFTDNPSTVTSSTWTAATTPFTFPSGTGVRCELTVVGNVVYGAPTSTSSVGSVVKSTDGGVTWATTALTATNISDLNGTGGQAIYCFGIGADPSNANNVILGNLNCLKTTDGGVTWSKLSEWVGLVGQYVHADVHSVNWFDGGNKLLISSDGGLFYSTDGGTTIRDRNTNLRIKQFYSCALHPTSTNYFLAGAQDNGTHQLNGAGLASSVEVKGGDGAFVAIDRNEPQYQFGAYIYNQYRRSTNGGTSWGQVDYSSSAGKFINPWDYDNINNRIYGSWSVGAYFRWDDPQTGATAVSQAIAAFNSATVSAVFVSPITAHTVFFGTDAGRVVKVTAANSAAPVATNLTAATMPASAYVSCVNIGTNEQNLIMCFSNYGVSNIWVTTNGGTSWTTIDGNLPDMPVRWVMFKPNENDKAFIATETGVWETSLINGASTVWTAHPSFPTVKTTMLDYRNADRTLLASTHGRGLWTAIITDAVLPITLSDFKGYEKNNDAILNWQTSQEVNSTGFDIEKSLDGVSFETIGFVKSVGTSVKKINYNFTDPSLSAHVQYYRLKQLDNNGHFTYSKIVTITTNPNKLSIIKRTNPFSSTLQIGFNKSISDNCTVELLDLSGRLVFSIHKANNAASELTIDVPSNLNNGIYIARITVGKQQFVEKLMKL